MKTLCTASIFCLLVGAIVAMCVIQVPDPLHLTRPGFTVPLLFPVVLIGGVLFMAGLLLVGIWVGADGICSALRKRFL